ncbi:DNA/RNA-binding protein Alba 4, putative [Babesia caballi]|uniref:DNA/RNA-binding protein Alba 4, putative n=1 Tax=Babesia caballi TaxID=5871 RepID=A0AAV4LV06_BABCB|nr:DNA/RNA-binding protein Alba 4, putative [Babesia caballi]
MTPADETPKRGPKVNLEAITKEYPNSKVLLISAQRQRAFFIRTSCELLAGGTEVLILSALGDAIPYCVQLQHALMMKNATNTIRFETSLNKCFSSRGRGSVYIPGVQIVMRKHPLFKGSRISPAHVTFAAQPQAGELAHAFRADAGEKCCKVIAGDATLGMPSKGSPHQHFTDLLRETGHDIDAYSTLFKTLYKEALELNAADPDAYTVTMAKSAFRHPDVMSAICRLPKDQEAFKATGEGVVFVCIFIKRPYGNVNNMGIVYVVEPSAKNYADLDEYYRALHATGENLMTAVCDHNGMAKRDTTHLYQPISRCSTYLICGDKNRHPMATKLDTAKHILNGIAEGYRHGPASMFHFAYDEDAFRHAWTETSGLSAEAK